MKSAIELEASCRLCAHAVVLESGEHCLCKRRGVVYSYGKCRRFRPDVLKFSPGMRRDTPVGFSADEIESNF